MTHAEVMALIDQNAYLHQDKTPTLGTLLEEVAELARALEGKHDDHPGLELVQIGGIVANMLRKYKHDEVDSAMWQRESRRRQEAT
jgi:hypothetical protein